MRKNSIILLFFLGVVQSVFPQNNKGFIPDSCSYMVISQPSKTTKYSRLVYGNNYRFPFLMTNNAMLLLTDDEVKKTISFVLPDEMMNCDESFVLNELLICRYGNTIKAYNGKIVKKLMVQQDEDYRIYPDNGNSFYLIKYEQDSSFVYLFDLATEKLQKMFNVPFHIDCFAGSGKECFITSGEMIYFVSDEICTIAEVADSRVQSIDFYSDGAFFSTEKACCYMGLPGKSYPFLLGDIKQLMLVDNRLYLLFRDGLLSVIDKADQYEVLLDKVVNEAKKKENEKH